MRIRYLAVGLAALAVLPAAGVADPGDNRRGIPRGHLPPPGECRVWYPGVPAGQQPPPTDCRTARREARYYGGRVIRGGWEGRDEYRRYARRGERYHNQDESHYDRRDRSDRRDYRCDEKDWRKGEC